MLADTCKYARTPTRPKDDAPESTVVKPNFTEINKHTQAYTEIRARLNRQEHAALSGR